MGVIGAGAGAAPSPTLTASDVALQVPWALAPTAKSKRATAASILVESGVS
eukprot:COSAG01_NODE_1015_length_12114_cov_214.545651_2_plen_51_part_00